MSLNPPEETMRVKDLELQMERLAMRREIPAHHRFANIKFKTMMSNERDRMVMELWAYVATEPLAEIRHPADWWQAVKDRWFPAWALRRWPVRYTRYDVKAFYPTIKVPEHQGYVRVLVNEDVGAWWK